LPSPLINPNKSTAIWYDGIGMRCDKLKRNKSRNYTIYTQRIWNSKNMKVQSQDQTSLRKCNFAVYTSKTAYYPCGQRQHQYKSYRYVIFLSQRSQVQLLPFCTRSKRLLLRELKTTLSYPVLRMPIHLQCTGKNNNMFS